MTGKPATAMKYDKKIPEYKSNNNQIPSHEEINYVLQEAKVIIMTRRIRT